MVVVRFRSDSEAKDTIKKLKKMKHFVKELIECFESKHEDDDDYDEDEDYRHDDDDYYDDYEDMHHKRIRERRARYRRGM